MEEQKYKINPDYLKASHVELLVYPGAPSFEDQLAKDAEVQKQLQQEVNMEKTKSMFDSDAMRELAKAFEESEEKHRLEILNHPDNGKSGYWRVDGIRHSAIAKASSAREAIDKASDIVGDWEMPSVVYLGESLPDVISV